MRHGISTIRIWRSFFHLNSKKLSRNHCKDVFSPAQTKKNFYRYHGSYLSSQTTSKLSSSESTTHPDQEDSRKSAGDEPLLQDHGECNSQPGSAQSDNSETLIDGLGSTSTSSQRPVLDGYVPQPAYGSASRLTRKRWTITNPDINIGQVTSKLDQFHITEATSGHATGHADDSAGNENSGPRGDTTQLPGHFGVHGGSIKRPASGGNGDHPDKKPRKDPPQDSPEDPKYSDDSKFACPFVKYNSSTYRKCERYKFKNVAQVKQHLVRVHEMGDHYCKTCHRYCDPKTNPDVDHVKCDRSTDVPVEQYECHLRFKAGARRRGTEEEKWYFVYRALFPQDAEPENSQAEEALSEGLEGFLRFLGDDPEIKNKLGLDFIKTRLESSSTQGQTFHMQNTIIKRIREILSSRENEYMQPLLGMPTKSGSPSRTMRQIREQPAETNEHPAQAVSTVAGPDLAQIASDQTVNQPKRILRRKPGNVGAANARPKPSNTNTPTQMLPHPQHILPSQPTQTDLDSALPGTPAFDFETQAPYIHSTYGRERIDQVLNTPARYPDTSAIRQPNTTRYSITALSSTVATQNQTLMPNSTTSARTFPDIAGDYTNYQVGYPPNEGYSGYYANNSNQGGVYLVRDANSTHPGVAFQAQPHPVLREQANNGVYFQPIHNSTLPNQQREFNRRVSSNRAHNSSNHHYYQQNQY